MAKDRLIITYKPIGDLKPYDRNPRKISDAAVAAVAASIRKFKFRMPIVVDADNVIVAGHTRWLAAQKLGLAEVPTVSAADLTAQQIKAYRLADNKTAEISAWDLPLLDQELADIDDDLDMTEFGFTPDAAPDMDSFFDNTGDGDAEKKPKEVTCPYCHKTFTP